MMRNERPRWLDSPQGRAWPPCPGEELLQSELQKRLSPRGREGREKGEGGECARCGGGAAEDDAKGGGERAARAAEEEKGGKGAPRSLAGGGNALWGLRFQARRRPAL